MVVMVIRVLQCYFIKEEEFILFLTDMRVHVVSISKKDPKQNAGLNVKKMK